MRQTLHLVMRDYALLRAALSETNHLNEMPAARRLAPAAMSSPPRAPSPQPKRSRTWSESTGSGALRHGGPGEAPACAHLLPHHETALWHARPEARFVAIDEPEVHVPVEARAEILHRYLAAFGPASRRDIAAWAMMHMTEIDAALERLEPLRRFRDERGRELLDVPRAAAGPRDPAPVRFLPKWDNVLLAFADRTRVLPEGYRKRVIGMNGDVAQTFLVEGFVAGTWRVGTGASRSSPSRRSHARSGASSGTRRSVSKRSWLPERPRARLERPFSSVFRYWTTSQRGSRWRTPTTPSSSGAVTTG